MTETRDILLGRVATPGAVWEDTPADKEASDLREKALRFLDAQGALSDSDLRRMVALLFLGRA